MSIPTRIKNIAETLTVNSKTITAFDKLPTHLLRSDLPAMVVFPSTSRRIDHAPSEHIKNQRFELRFFFLEWNAEHTGQLFVDYDSWQTAIENLFVSRPQLQYNDTGLEGVLESTLDGDTGILAASYPPVDGAQTYVAMYFPLSVINRRRIARNPKGA